MEDLEGGRQTRIGAKPHSFHGGLGGATHEMSRDEYSRMYMGTAACSMCVPGVLRSYVNTVKLTNAG